MKPLINLIVLLCISAFLRETSPAQPADADQFPQIHLDAKFIESEKSLFQTTRILPRAKFDNLVAALSAKSGVDLLSTPSVVTRDNQPAVIEVVREFTYPVGKSDTGEEDVETMNVGTTLSVRPQIEGEKIRLAGKATIREFDNKTSTRKTLDLPASVENSDSPVALSFRTVETLFNLVLAKDQCAVLHCRRLGSRQKDVVLLLDARLITSPDDALSKPKDNARHIVLPKK